MKNKRMILLASILMIVFASTVFAYTFIVGDDFNDNSFDTDLWHTYKTSDFAEINNRMEMYVAAADYNSIAIITNDRYFWLPGTNSEIQVVYNEDVSLIEFVAINPDNQRRYGIYLRYGDVVQAMFTNATGSYELGSIEDSGSTGNLKMRMSSYPVQYTIEFYFNDELFASATYDLGTYSPAYIIGTYGNADWSGAVYFDNFCVYRE